MTCAQQLTHGRGGHDRELAVCGGTHGVALLPPGELIGSWADAPREVGPPAPGRAGRGRNPGGQVIIPRGGALSGGNYPESAGREGWGGLVAGAAAWAEAVVRKADAERLCRGEIIRKTRGGRGSQNVPLAGEG